ncbi:PREDICTED: uncharacterized protein LOC105460667 [Wasmannia auropunctata]|uniref:uncharacterized protein LOC105460667 n=1 Tax=Wasmannia auropunctata TaxID=64793 RepID=UPI0005F0A894|nr:PREDICTED: uncharacterized protein LOC105460667 [Wasmannia auropunctata]XP_011705474.1 PREDICTED: uncharacterized protein LOC105460667 [Wasmannia auropunctata]XP_011705482.1 PREDICTED: uncharacterized protein LOC105460667 [Wasmannia auropunctata]
MAAVVSTKWGAQPESMLCLYRAIFRGAIEYGSLIFRIIGNRRVFLKLERLQYRAIRLALGYRMSTPINIMLAEAKEVPLETRFIYLSDKFLYKAYSSKFNLVTRSLRRLESLTTSAATQEKAKRTIPIFSRFIATKHALDSMHRSSFLPAFYYDYHTSIYRKDFDFSMPIGQKDSSPMEVLAKFQEYYAEVPLETTAFYTDGSRSDKSSMIPRVFLSHLLL